MTMALVPDLVKLSKLDTLIDIDQNLIQHVTYVPGNNTNPKRTRKEEVWKEKRRIGRGGFGSVYLQECTHGDNTGGLRAVKEIPKHGPVNYYKELEAIALFSHAKYEQHFAKSFGWYDDSGNIYLTMEYFPHGDLQGYLGLPLPESQSQLLTMQILDGLFFMHDYSFAHRDLKPNNILVMCRGPEWWVKIADFGISKRAVEGVTNLHTRTGTPGFTAPEVSLNDDTTDQSYTNAVDIWSLSVITFLMLTGQSLFTDARRLEQFVRGDFGFPTDMLITNKVSEQGCNFVKSLMQPKPENRPQVDNCRKHPWLKGFLEELKSQRDSTTREPTTFRRASSNLQPSASWSPSDQISPQGIIASTSEPINRPVAKQKETRPAHLDPWASHDWSELCTLKSNSDQIQSFIYSPKGKRLACIAGGRNVELWDTATGLLLRTLELLTDITDIAFSPNGKRIASISADKDFKIWDTVTGALCKSLRIYKSAFAVTYSPNGKQLACGCENSIQLRDPATGALLRTLDGHLGWKTAFAYQPGGQQLAYASSKAVKLWDTATGALLYTIEGHTGAVTSLAYSPNGEQLISGSTDRTVRLFDLTRGRINRVLRGHTRDIHVVKFCPMWKQIASQASDGELYLWNLEQGSEEKLCDGGSQFKSLAYSPNGMQIASTGEHGASIWDPVSGKLLQELAGCYSAVVYSPNGEQVAIGSDKGTIKLLGPETLAE